VSFAAITPCVASQRVLIVVSLHFVIDSVRKLLVTPSYICTCSGRFIAIRDIFSPTEEGEVRS